LGYLEKIVVEITFWCHLLTALISQAALLFSTPEALVVVFYHRAFLKHASITEYASNAAYCKSISDLLLTRFGILL